MPIKYAVDSISLPDMQQAACDLLGQDGRLVIFPPPAVKTAQENDVVSVNGMLRGPPNIELLEIFYHDHLERLLKEGALKVSHTVNACFYLLLIEYGSQTKLK